MRNGSFAFKDRDDVEIFVYKWLPDNSIPVKAVVQIAHGMAETASRYKRFASALTDAGYVVYANDHRGHGRTAKKIEDVGYLGDDGFNWMVEDMGQLNSIIKDENPGIPVFLFGHSMGSLLAQEYICRYGSSTNGVILSGTSGKQGFMVDIGILLAKREMNKLGPKGKSQLMNKLTFGSYNNEFKPTRTNFDWLSRDEKEVDKYINNPYCGGVFSSRFFYDFLKGIKGLNKKEDMENIPKDLAIYVMSGEKDPVGKNCKTVTKLIDTYKSIGIRDVTYKFYKDGRHEMLNEINRDEATQDIIRWLSSH